MENAILDRDDSLRNDPEERYSQLAVSSKSNFEEYEPTVTSSNIT
jgi:hypothetical protein